MTKPRKVLISLSDTPYYHIISRCVRRSYLCGFDKVSGRNYEHRRQWIVDRIRLLSSIFAIDICAYAVMHNHYHLVLKINPEQLDKQSDNDIIDKWCMLFKGPLLIQHYRKGKPLSNTECETIREIVSIWRKRLSSISWFMRCLNQPIARQANLEDECRGHFWEARFKSQALKTEEALLTCMVYVDLNPIRADIANTPENSDYTSIQERIRGSFDKVTAIKSETQLGTIRYFDSELKPLLHFHSVVNSKKKCGIPIAFKDYLELVDWTGRIAREGKNGIIADHYPSILDRLSLAPKQWLINTMQFETIYHRRFSCALPMIKTG